MGQWRNGAEARTRACTCSVVCTASTAHSTARYDASKPLAPARQATCPGPCKPAHYALTDLGNRRHDLLHDDVVTAGQAAPEELVGQIDGLAVQILHTSITHTMLPGSPFGNLNLTSGRPGSIARRPEQGFRAGALGVEDAVRDAACAGDRPVACSWLSPAPRGPRKYLRVHERARLVGHQVDLSNPGRQSVLSHRRNDSGFPGCGWL